MALRLLLIDDDARLAELLASYFEGHDVSLVAARDGASGLDQLARGTFDAILLDVMMPGLDGLEVLRRIRAKSSIPVIMLTARGDEADRVVGLEVGADDYVPKPFSPRELLARLRAVLRRSSPEATSERLCAGGVEVDVGARTARAGGELVDLTGLELDLLVALMRP
ncbi:MAG: response regulator transcription factor, partial [Sandaracinaceae bacterium]|nr:response regulator transcription factor [Sandaracinaceae bacterium]